MVEGMVRGGGSVGGGRKKKRGEVMGEGKVVEVERSESGGVVEMKRMSVGEIGG